MSEFIIDEFDLIKSISNLDGTFCCLWHHKDEKLPLAVDYIVQDVGFDGNVTEQIRIPVCQHCINSLISGEWVLFYCIQCNESRWHWKKKSKTEWGDTKIKFFDGCPCCNKKRG